MKLLEKSYDTEVIAPEEQIKIDLKLQEIRNAENENRKLNQGIKVPELKVKEEELIQPRKVHLENNKSKQCGVPEAQKKTHLDMKFLDMRDIEAELFIQSKKLHLETNIRGEVGAPEEQNKTQMKVKFLDIEPGYFKKPMKLLVKNYDRDEAGATEKQMKVDLDVKLLALKMSPLRIKLKRRD